MSVIRIPRRDVASLLVAVLAAASLSAQQSDPLPLAVATSLQSHVGRCPIDLAPDGEWVAHTSTTSETVARDTDFFARTGKPFAEGNARMRAWLTNTRTDEAIALGGASGSSWAPVWSPDGARVAFYCDDDGEAGLWIWEKATGKATRFPGIVVRPFFGFEIVRFSADGRRLLCKVLPEGMSLAEANALVPASDEVRRFPAHGPDEPAVLVHRSAARKADDKQAPEPTGKPRSTVFANRSLADLALLDLQTHAVTRIAKRVKTTWYAFSPDGQTIAYSDLQGFAPDAQQPSYDLRAHDPANGRTKTLVANAHLSYGIEVNWSPDSSRLAYMACGQLAKGEFVVVSLADGSARNLGAPGLPSFDISDGERAPLWDASGKSLFGIGKDDKLWRVDVASSHGEVVGDIADHRITAVVTRPELPTLWTTDDGHTAWVITRERQGDKRAGLFRIDLKTGRSDRAIEEDKSYSTVFNLDASDTSSAIACLPTDQQHPGDVWIFATKSNTMRQASHLNPSLERYALGTARVIEWSVRDGTKLRGSLLLPPDWSEGRRLPLVVWVYGGSTGSDYKNRFGFWGHLPTFNMHVLATRGFAVLFPDAPIRAGTPLQDLVDAVLPGVDAAIEQGYADPDRLAVMGQSYGSYCSLALIGQTGRFKAAVITAAVLHPDLFAAYLEMSADGNARSTGYYEHGQGNMGGTPWEHRDRYLANSPLFLFDRIVTPVLIGQGDEDGRLIASDAVFVALRRLGKEVEYRIYQGEGHVITQRPNVLDFWQRRLDFLDEHLDVARDATGRMQFDGGRARSRK